MSRRDFTCAALVFVAACLAPVGASAQGAPDVLEHFSVMPRLSMLRQMGGFAGFDLRYRMVGQYDFHNNVAGIGDAGFLNVEVYGSLLSGDPAHAVAIDVGQILNLEGLTGELLPLGAPFDAYRFTGNSPEGSHIELLAAMIGPWMYLRGGTQPPLGGADFFEYQVRAVARSTRFFDFNEDGSVDAADYTVLRDSAGASGLAAAGDFAGWRAQFGEKIPDLDYVDAIMSTAATSTGSPVPEPCAARLALMAAATLRGVCRSLSISRLKRR